MKRIVAMLLIVGMLLCSSAPFVFAANGQYVSRDDSYIPPEGDYVTREEVIAGFVRAVGLEVSNVHVAVLTRFQDSGKIASAYRNEIAAAVSEGWITGYDDGTFRPRSTITRLEALVVLKRILADKTFPVGKPKGFVDVPDWAREDIAFLDGAGIVKGYGNGFLGSQDLLTGQQAELLTRRAARLVGPAGDFYEYVNGDWLAETEIPQGQLAWSDLNVIVQARMKEIGEIVYSLYRRRYKEQEEFPQGSSEQKIVDVFTAGSNTVYRDSLGLEPVQEYLALVDGVKDMNDLLKVMATLEYNGFHGLFPLSLTTDVYDSSKSILTFSECYTGMNISLVQSRDADRAVSAYEAYLTELFTLFGAEQTAAEQRAADVAALCQKLARGSMPLEAHNEVAAHYTVYDGAGRKGFFTQFDCDTYMKELGFPTSAKLLLYDRDLAALADSLWKKENLELLKDYLRVSVMDGAAVYLNTDAFLAWRNYQDALNGVESGVLPADYAVSMVEELVSWDLAKLYVERYTSKTEKKEIEAMTQKILEAYKNRLQNNTWMSQESKQVALRKLDNLQVRVAYPEDMDVYLDAGYEIRSTRDGGNLLEYRVGYCNRYFDKAIQCLSHPTAVSKNIWTILPQTVNALYEPSTNSITIPAGILHSPIYDSNDSFEGKLGGIGAVIAHEISHALDSLGSQFDENGNLTNWWTAEDKAAFDIICKQVEEAYDKIEVLPGYTINGKLTLGENLADLAGMACVLDIAGENNPRLGELFRSYAAAWRTKTTESYLKLQQMTDSHAADKVRVNRVLANFDAFADFYDLREGDGMYIPPEERIRIW